MQVKKFEARTIKDAIEMVKRELGPDAVILSVRDNKKSFGLVGEKSVEITAAASDSTMHKKKFVESRLPEEKKDIFQNIPARMQKQVIEKFVQNHSRIQLRNKPAPTENKEVKIETPKSPALNKSNIFGSKRYIDIVDDEGIDVDTVAAHLVRTNTKQSLFQSKTSAKNIVPPTENFEIQTTQEVQSLKQEIQVLKDIISQFKTIPNMMMQQYPLTKFNLPHELSSLFDKLIHSGLSEKNTVEFLQLTNAKLTKEKLSDFSYCESVLARVMLDKIRTSGAQISNKKFHCFLGPSGSGKTSMLVKLASHLLLKEGKQIAIATTDTMKVGAAEQLKIYSHILNVPFMVIRTARDWERLMRYSQQFDQILVDFPGNSLKAQPDSQLMYDSLPPAIIDSAVHLVLSASSNDEDISIIGKRFAKIGYNSVMFTHLDSAYKPGVILNHSLSFHKPISAFGIGPKLPEDFEFATAERVLDLILRITKQEDKQAEVL